MKNHYPNLWDYYKTGLERKIDKTYICTHRSPWYTQEFRAPAPFLCTYMGRNGGERESPFRFILNCSKAVVANVYLMIYPKPALSKFIKESPDSLKKSGKRSTKFLRTRFSPKAGSMVAGSTSCSRRSWQTQTRRKWYSQFRSWYSALRKKITICSQAVAPRPWFMKTVRGKRAADYNGTEAKVSGNCSEANLSICLMSKASHLIDHRKSTRLLGARLI